jgi:endonuclease III
VVSAHAWFYGMTEQERTKRVAPLGLPILKRQAVDGIAVVLDAHEATNMNGDLWGVLQAQPGIGPYTAGMVTLLMGGEAAPVDCNVARVGQRVSPDVAPAAWCAEVIAAARELPSPLPEFPAGYIVISAILDVGATRCRIGWAPQCAGCPLAGGCEYEARGPRQMEMWA